MGKPIQYSHTRQGDTIKVEIKDFTRRTLYKCKFNIQDKNAIVYLIKAIEKYSGFSVIDIIEDKLKVGEWW